MVTLVLTAEQAKVLADAKETVELIDTAGTRLGVIERPLSDADIETALARLAEARNGKTTVEVLATLMTMDAR